MNQGLFERPVVEGEQLYFGFRCQILMPDEHRHRSSDDLVDHHQTTESGAIARSGSLTTSSNQPVLHVILRDEFDKTFRQVLPLNLNELYGSIWKKEQYRLGVFGGISASATLICGRDQKMREGLVGTSVPFTYRIDVLQSKRRRPRKRIKRRVSYRISCARGDWILGGKIRGSFDIVMSPSSSSPASSTEEEKEEKVETEKEDEEESIASFDLHFVGVPSMAGVLKRFPEVKLAYLPSTKLSSPLQSPCSISDDDDCKDKVNKDKDASRANKIEEEVLPPFEVRLRHPDSFMALAYKSQMALACLSPSDGLQ